MLFTLIISLIMFLSAMHGFPLKYNYIFHIIPLHYLTNDERAFQYNYWNYYE